MKTLHIIGIGGIGMSALAWIALKKGWKVTGSDMKESALITRLREKGAEVFIGQYGSNIKGHCDVVFSTAIKKDNPEYVKALSLGCTMWHRCELLQHFTEEKRELVVAGAHGKTTTSCLLAHVLGEAGHDPSFAVGGIAPSLVVNGQLGEGVDFVVEGDESDGSFLKTNPYAAIITGSDPDHIYFWKSEEALRQGYQDFVDGISERKNLVYCIDDLWLREIAKGGLSYGFSEDAELKLLCVEEKNGMETMTFSFKQRIYENVPLALKGEHNALNSLAVFGLCKILGLGEEEIFPGLRTFRGVERRMQEKGFVNGVLYIDDYAHHPSEVKATLQTIRNRDVKGKTFVVFQPHRYTRFIENMHDFANALMGDEEVVVTDVYAAGEKVLKEAHPEKLIELLRLVSKKNVTFIPREELHEYLFQEAKPGDIVLGMGAGDITKLKSQVEHCQ